MQCGPWPRTRPSSVYTPWPLRASRDRRRSLVQKSKRKGAKFATRGNHLLCGVISTSTGSTLAFSFIADRGFSLYQKKRFSVESVDFAALSFISSTVCHQWAVGSGANAHGVGRDITELSAEDLGVYPWSNAITAAKKATLWPVEGKVRTILLGISQMLCG